MKEGDMGSLKGKDILHGNQFSRKEIEAVMKVASEFEKELKKKGVVPLMKGKLLATLFFEPSTRTRLSFETAMQRLGGGVIGLGSLEGSSVAKGETLVDTCRTVAQYADVIAIRHPKTGSAKEAADAVDIPVLNGGDGTGQHPTQALLDVYTIYKEMKTLKNLTIAMVGDLKNGRTVHALVEILVAFQLYPLFRFAGCASNAGRGYLAPETEGDQGRGDGGSQKGCTEERRDLYDPNSKRTIWRSGGV